MIFDSDLLCGRCQHPKELGVPGGRPGALKAKMFRIHFSFRVEYKEGKVLESQSRDHRSHSSGGSHPTSLTPRGNFCSVQA